MNWDFLTAAHVSLALTLLHVTTVTAIALRVVMRKPPVGVALAWLLLVSAFPAFGAGVYLLIGERRVGQRRAERIAKHRADYRRLSEQGIHHGLTNVNWDRHHPDARAMNQLGARLVGVPTVAGSSGRLLTNSEEILRCIAADIDSATSSVLMEFYIWNQGGLADEVVAALIRATKRGVACRVLVDAIGARPWWKGEQPAELRAAGVKVQQAFPSGLWQMVFGRNDLRLHRKIVVIDDRIAWTGSMNLVDPRYFKQDAHCGEWVDAMARMEGAVVSPLAMTLIGDWVLETNESIEEIIDCAGLDVVEPKGGADVQVVPSGPIETDDGLLLMLLTLINAARKELVLTTPYFIPDESLMRAIRAAAASGVQVHLVLPEKVDSFMARYASRSYYAELMDVGVQIHLFKRGLLHTKSITVDNCLSMFGTVNLDMRSLWLNYEVSLFLYGEAIATPIRSLQQSYIQDSELLSPDEWKKRSLQHRILENVLRLTSPLL